MKAYQKALQQSVKKRFDNSSIHCMSLPNDVYFNLSDANTIRSSDDYFPTREDSHALHLVANAYNTTLLGHFAICDWDMFHSKHPQGRFHAMARVLSGGPVYVSDRPGEHDVGLIQSITLESGKAIRCPEPARIVERDFFSDPLSSTVFLKIKNQLNGASLMGIFHCSLGQKEKAITETIHLSDFIDGPQQTYAIWNSETGEVQCLEKTDTLNITLTYQTGVILQATPLKDGQVTVGNLAKLLPIGDIKSVID
jgi:raffinose synthase